jgi:hypothetical protein
MPFRDPVAIDPVDLSNDPVFARSGIGSQCFPTISWGGKLYMTGVSDVGFGGTGRWNVFESDDNGQTWTPLDPTNAPEYPTGKSVYDGADTIWVAYLEFPFVAEDPVPILVRAFDLNTLTWGAENATTQETFEVACIGARSDGSLVIIFSNDGTIPGGAIYWAGSYSAGTLTLIDAIDANVSGGNLGQIGTPRGIVDPATDTFHMVFSGSGGGLGIASQSFHQAISSGDALIDFFAFPNTDTPEFPNINVIGFPCIFNGDVFVPIVLATDVSDPATYFAGGYVGSPASGPTWTQVPTLNGLALNPDYPSVADLEGAPPYATADDTTVYVVYTVPSSNPAFDAGRVAMCQSNDLVTWVGSTAFDVSDDVSFQRGGAQEITNPAIAPVSFRLNLSGYDPSVIQYQRWILDFSVRKRRNTFE